LGDKKNIFEQFKCVRPLTPLKNQSNIQRETNVKNYSNDKIKKVSKNQTKMSPLVLRKSPIIESYDKKKLFGERKLTLTPRPRIKLNEKKIFSPKNTILDEKSH
jgi:hypothetical protein